jgi:hypothetical protein
MDVVITSCLLPVTTGGSRNNTRNMCRAITNISLPQTTSNIFIFSSFNNAVSNSE